MSKKILLDSAAPTATISNEQVLLGPDPDAVLDTGMRVREAAARAAFWWDTKGRAIMLKKEKNKAFASTEDHDPNFVKSGILTGQPWDALTQREKLQVIKSWHHFFVRRPDRLDKDPNAAFRLTTKGEKPE